MKTNVEEVLRDLSQGKITKEEAKRLIENREKTLEERSIKVMIRDKRGKNIKVNIPVRWAYKVFPWVDKFEKNGVDIRESLEEALKDPDFAGEVCNVETDDGELVVVTIV